MPFINSTETIGIIIGNANTTTTGSMIVTLMILLIIILAIALLLQIRLEFTVVLVFPLLLSYMAYYGEFIAIGVVFIFYLALILTKMFLFK